MDARITLAVIVVLVVVVVVVWSAYNSYTGWRHGVLRVRMETHRAEDGGISFYAYLLCYTAMCIVVPLGFLATSVGRPRPGRSVGVEESRPPHGAAVASPPGAVHTPPPSGAADTPPPRAASTSSPRGASDAHPKEDADGGEERPGPIRRGRKEFSLIQLVACLAWCGCFMGWRFAIRRLGERPWKPSPEKALFFAGMILLTCLCVILTIGVFVL